MTLPTSDAFMHVLAAYPIAANFEINIVVCVVRGSVRTSDLTRLSIVLHKHQPLFIIYFRPSLKKKMQNRDTWTHL